MRLRKSEEQEVRELLALRPTDDFTDDGRALQRRFPARAAQAGDVQQHVLQTRLVRIVGDDEAVPLSRIEPLYTAAYPHGLERCVLIDLVARHLPLWPRPQYASEEGRQ